MLNKNNLEGKKKVRGCTLLRFNTAQGVTVRGQTYRSIKDTKKSKNTYGIKWFLT